MSQNKKELKKFCGIRIINKKTDEILYRITEEEIITKLDKMYKENKEIIEEVNDIEYEYYQYCPNCKKDIDGLLNIKDDRTLSVIFFRMCEFHGFWSYTLTFKDKEEYEKCEYLFGFSGFINENGKLIQTEFY